MRGLSAASDFAKRNEDPGPLGRPGSVAGWVRGLGAGGTPPGANLINALYRILFLPGPATVFSLHVSERRTGATLGDMQLRSHLLNAGTATRGA
jgi:hypothetical protein